MGRYRRKKNYNVDHIYKKSQKKMFNKGIKYIDQIYDDMKAPEKANKKIGDPETPGFGRFYCIACSRWFESQKTLDTHKKTKPHKRRVKKLKTEECYYGPDVKIDNGDGKATKPFSVKLSATSSSKGSSSTLPMATTTDLSSTTTTTTTTLPMTTTN